jgi:hypothetical protein
VVAIALSAFSTVTLWAVVGFLVEIANGHTHKPMFWPTAAVTLLFAVWVLPRTTRACRRLARRAHS